MLADPLMGIALSMRIDGDVPRRTRPIAAAAIDAGARQRSTVLVRQPRYLAQMIGPAFHRPYLHPSLGMRHVLIQLPKHGTSTATPFADLGHGAEEVAAVFLVHPVMHRLHHPAADPAKRGYQFGGGRFGHRQGLGRRRRPTLDGEVDGECAYDENEARPE